MKKFRKFLCLTSVLVCAASPLAFGSVSFLSSLTGGDEINRDMRDLEAIYRFAKENYLYDIDYKKVYESMATAMLDAFGDKWTQYITSDVSSKYAESIHGSFSGIGVYLTKVSPGNQNPEDEKTLYLQITSCFKNGPAAKAGLKAGDLITHINSQNIKELTGTECSTLLRGEAGTQVTVTVKRKSSEPFDIAITREVVNTPSVETQMLQDNILYMNINSFASNTAEQVRTQLENNKRLNGLILDIRDNGGGDVKSCLEIADMFIPEDKVLISTKSKVKERQKTHTSTRGTSISKRVPIVLLINNGSASASEILAAALHDNSRAILIGEKTYGKGVMQVSSPYKDGYINVTTAEYYTPNGEKVHEKGIEPDISIPQHLISEDETNALLALDKEKKVKDFIQDNPKFDDANFTRCFDMVRKSEQYDAISDMILKQYILSSYLANIDPDTRELVYPQYDPVLKKSVEVIMEKIGLSF